MKTKQGRCRLKISSRQITANFLKGFFGGLGWTSKGKCPLEAKGFCIYHVKLCFMLIPLSKMSCISCIWHILPYMNNFFVCVLAHASENNFSPHLSHFISYSHWTRKTEGEFFRKYWILRKILMPFNFRPKKKELLGFPPPPALNF